MFTKEEILLILQLIEEKHGHGYSNEPMVGRLQAKLSILLEVCSVRAALVEAPIDTEAFFAED